MKGQIRRENLKSEKATACSCGHLAVLYQTARAETALGLPESSGLESRLESSCLLGLQWDFKLGRGKYLCPSVPRSEGGVERRPGKK